MNDLPKSINVEWVIGKLKEIEKLNNKLQATTVVGSKDWHDHETIDDIIYDLLQHHGD